MLGNGGGEEVIFDKLTKNPNRGGGGGGASQID